ncbi:MAG: D-alanine--D-alanine ligase A [Gammaproteobacteria bacterium RIFCSPHIGHO2_12_FULL_40_19]|nr:MAG: D-alanine--D-alanine ligase A [Gammaproteobacteria bacterium RIFCSPHIGHO2_12_FULL_40_19]
MSKHLSILVLCGGQSTEHDISLLSARNVIERLDSKKYQVSIAKISQDGTWYYFKNADHYFSDSHTHLMHIVPGHKNPFFVGNDAIPVDCVFPVLHGTNGEDGTMQGLLEILQVPYVGADCLGSTIGMDKEVLKRLLHEAHLPVVDRCLVRKSEIHKINYKDVTQQLGDILFVKPNSVGSAVGVNKATDEDSFHAALQEAFRYDEYVLIEKAIIGREIECSVLGNENPTVSYPGEIINHTAFYSYEAKYLDEAASTVKSPADLSPELIAQFQSLALKAYQVLRSSGMARVDFFLDRNNNIYINEINTIPGFTNISMYPKNWEASGLSYTDLLDQLITLGMKRFEYKRTLTRVFQTTEMSAVGTAHEAQRE